MSDTTLPSGLVGPIEVGSTRYYDSPALLSQGEQLAQDYAGATSPESAQAYKVAAGAVEEESLASL